MCQKKKNHTKKYPARQLITVFCLGTAKNGQTRPEEHPGQRHWRQRRNVLVVVQKHVVVEAALDRGAVAEAAAVHLLHGFTQDVGAGVPVNLHNTQHECEALLYSTCKT